MSKFVHNQKYGFKRGPTSPRSLPNVNVTEFRPSRGNSAQVSPSSSTSFTEKSEPSIISDCFYEPEDVLRLKPTAAVEKTLNTPGYVILCALFEGRTLVTDERNQNKRNLDLVEHKERFIPSAIRKKFVQFDPKEEKVYTAQMCLNRLNESNIHNVMSELTKLDVEPKLIMDLLIQRATVDEDSPEKNRQLKNFAQLAINMANSWPEFKLICKTMSLDQYYSGLNDYNKDEKSISLNVISCILVWISLLVQGRIVRRRDYFQCLEKATKIKPVDNAINLIRASLFTCGKFLDENKWNESATFYSFINNKPKKSGFISFLSSDLERYRNSDWNEQYFLPEKKTKLEKKLDGNDLEEELFTRYQNWHDDPAFGTPRVPPNADIRNVIFSVIKNYANKKQLDDDYAKWVSLLIKNAETDQKVIPELLEKSKSLIPDGKLAGFYSILGKLYSESLINFATIVSLGVLQKPEYVDSLGKATYIDQKEICNSLPQSGSSLNNDVIVSLTMITDWSETQEDSTNIYSKAVEFSRYLFEGVDEVEPESNPEDIFEEYKSTIIDLGKCLNQDLVSKLWRKIINESNTSDDFKSKAIEYFNGYKF